MRIGIDIRCLLDEPRSGVGEYTYNFLVKLFQENKKNTFVLFSSGLNTAGFLRVKSMFEKFDNLDFFHLRYPNKLINFLWWLRLGPKIDKLLQVPVIWFPQFNFLKVSSQVRTIITCHDVSFINLNKLYSYKGRLWHWFVRPLDLYKKFDVVLAVSQSTRRDLISLGISADKIKVVYPVVIGSKFTEQAPTIDDFNLPAKFFFYVGTLDARKNIITLLESFNEFVKKSNQDIYLLIGGRPGWHSRRYYKKLFKLLLHSKYIKYLGYVPEKNLSFFYQKALAFVYPSFYEGFGFPPLEAMQNSCPVISSYTSSLTEVVQDAAYLIDPYNKNDFIKSFTTLATQESYRSNLIARGRQMADFWKNEKKTSYKNLFKILAKPDLS